MKRILPAAVLAAALAATAQAGPAMKTEGAVTYACGGVGAGERAELKALAAGANVEIFFVTEKRGGYIADVEFTVAGAKGAALLKAVSEGPICVLRLPAGRYSVEATYRGATRKATLAAGAEVGRPQRVALAFPGEKWDGIWASDEEKRSARTP